MDFCISDPAIIFLHAGYALHFTPVSTAIGFLKIFPDSYAAAFGNYLHG